MAYPPFFSVLQELLTVYQYNEDPETPLLSGLLSYLHSIKLYSSLYENKVFQQSYPSYIDLLFLRNSIDSSDSFSDLVIFNNDDTWDIQQHDAHDFYLYVLNELSKECRLLTSSNSMKWRRIHHQ